MPVQVEMVGNRIWVRSPFKYKDRIKSIIGARWSPKDKVWTLPLDLETGRRLRDEFGDELQIGPALWEWGKQARAKETHLTSFTNITDIDIMSEVDLPRVRELCPGMWAAMQNRPYQPVASYYMAVARRCLNGDQPGIGKTIETLGALVEAGVSGPILILAPRTSCTVVWEPEIHKWMETYAHGYTVTQTAGLTAVKQQQAYDQFAQYVKGSNPGVMHFLIANAEQARIKKFTVCPAGICDGDEDWCPELAQHRNASETRRPFLHSMKWEAIVADETHNWLINTRGKNASQVGYGFTKLRTAREDSPMYALSGTPLKGKKWNLFGTLNWLWPKQYSSKWRWIGSYFEVVDDIVQAGRRTIETKNITGKWKSDKDREAFFRSLNTVMIRRTKDELRKINPGWAPPEKRYHDIYVDMDPKQGTQYRRMEKDAMVNLDGQVLTATGILAEMTRLKQFAQCAGAMEAGTFKPTLPSGKFTWLLQFLEERGIEAGGDLSDNIQKVVVASQFTSILNMFSQALGEKSISHVMITGEVKDADRSAAQRCFQEDRGVRVCLINTKAGGVSITLDAADDIVILDETWVPDEQEQVEDRVHRASNVEHQVDVWYVRSKGTIEESIAAVNAEKAESNHVVLDAQRGLRFASERFGVKKMEE